jgi:hypothetical protein
LGAHAVEEVVDAGGDVVADQPHALDAVDAALLGFVGVPVLELRSGGRLNVGLATQRHHDVDVAKKLRIDGLRCLVADVDFPPFLTHTKSTEGVETVSVIKSVSWPGRCQSR